MQRFVQICEQSGIRFKTVPALCDILSGQVNIREFRDVHLEDLLGRDPVEIDLRAVGDRIEGRVVLVTGAAGSIGSELCRQIWNTVRLPLSVSIRVKPEYFIWNRNSPGGRLLSSLFFALPMSLTRTA